MFTFRLVGLRISAKLRLSYLEALFSLPIGVLDTLPSGQASNTITTTANVLQVGISEKLGSILQYLALLIAAIIIAFTYSWALTLVTSSVLVFIALIYGEKLAFLMGVFFRILFISLLFALLIRYTDDNNRERNSSYHEDDKGH